MSKLERFKRPRPLASRKEETDAERTLWNNLHRIPIEGSHFRRQVEIGPYRADFGSLRLKLLVEVDGPIHGEALQRQYDRQRTVRLEEEGYRVIRFSNHQVATDLNSVLQAIGLAVDDQRTALGLIEIEHPTPALRADPPPRGEGKEQPDA